MVTSSIIHLTETNSRLNAISYPWSKSQRALSGSLAFCEEKSKHKGNPHRRKTSRRGQQAAKGYCKQLYLYSYCVDYYRQE